MPEKDPDAAPTRLAHYDLKEEIGRGALSVVHDAQDTRTGQQVALKLLTLPDSLTPEEAVSVGARFKHEAQAAARLSHPNIVEIYDTGSAQDRHFLALERLHGQTLRRRLSAGPLPLPEAFSILIQIAGALDAIHQAGLTHRAVKPTSVVLLPDGTAKLLDFGIALSAEGSSRQQAVLVGSPSYMAPEQIKGEGGDAALDIWALGVVSYEMLAGRLPFTGPSAGGVMHQIVHQPPFPMPHLPLSVQRVLLRVLDKQPAARYASAGSFVQALRLAYPAQAPAAAERKPAASPTPSTAEVKPAMPQAQPAPPPKPAASAPRTLPKWLPAAALFLFFLAGAAVMRLHPADHALEAVSHGSARHFGTHPAQAPVPPSIAQAADAAPGAVSTAAPPVPRWDAALPVKPAASIKAHAALIKTSAALPRLFPIASSVGPAAAAPRYPASARQAPQRLPMLPPRRLAAQAIRLPAQAQASVLHSASSLHPLLPSVMAPVAAQNSRLPDSVPAVSQAPAQSAGQIFTLPAEGGSYDPEAAARLRKSAWSQNRSASTDETAKQ